MEVSQNTDDTSSEKKEGVKKAVKRRPRAPRAKPAAK
jgi:hypothetical protein